MPKSAEVVVPASDWVPLVEHGLLRGREVALGSLHPDLACTVPAGATRVAGTLVVGESQPTSVKSQSVV